MSYGGTNVHCIHRKKILEYTLGFFQQTISDLQFTGAAEKKVTGRNKSEIPDFLLELMQAY